jgi:hypothetical protein
MGGKEQNVFADMTNINFNYISLINYESKGEDWRMGIEGGDEESLERQIGNLAKLLNAQIREN